MFPETRELNFHKRFHANLGRKLFLRGQSIFPDLSPSMRLQNKRLKSSEIMKTKKSKVMDGQKIGLKDNGNCSFCGDEPDTLTHLFWTCNKTQLFWMEVVVWLKECDVVRESYSLKMTTALGLKPDTSNFKLQINYCLLLARFFVWCCKVKEKGMRWCNFKQILKRNFEIETTTPQNKLELKKWNPLSLTF